MWVTMPQLWLAQLSNPSHTTGDTSHLSEPEQSELMQEEVEGLEFKGKQVSLGQ